MIRVDEITVNEVRCEGGTDMVMVTVRNGRDLGLGYTYGGKPVTRFIRDRLAPAPLERDILEPGDCWKTMAALRDAQDPALCDRAMAAQRPISPLASRVRRRFTHLSVPVSPWPVILSTSRGNPIWKTSCSKGR